VSSADFSANGGWLPADGGNLYNPGVRAVGLALLAGCVSASLLGAAAQQDQAAAIERAFQSFWAASDRSSAADRIDAILKTGVSFEEALSRLRRGRDYDNDVPRGIEYGRHRTFDALEHQYAYVIPETYDHTRPTQVRMHLHGGIGRRRPPAVTRLRTDALAASTEEISVFPLGWADAMWWSATQVDNLGRILDRLKRRYNVDENRVYLTGVSDGGTGVYFFAFRDTTPWASFLPLIGDMTVLTAPSLRADGEMFPGNAVNKPFFVVSAGRDRLYPAHVVQVYAEHLRKLGATVEFRVRPESEHGVSWWADERPAFEEFVHDHPREPLPDKIVWQTERTDRYNRAHWLIIDELGRVEGESRLPDSNLLRRGEEYDFGLRINSAADRGRRIQEVVAGSNAFAIGLRVGDRFLEINDQPVETGRDIFETMQRWEIGASLRFVVERAGKRVVLDGRFTPALVDVAPAPIFPRRRPSGRVDLARRGNVVEASTEGVRAFTLLLSPSLFDFRKPVTVMANGRTVYNGMVEPSVATMLKWAARDNDRTMVFGAELKIELTE
jgi:dienelactone hydrolase